LKIDYVNFFLGDCSKMLNLCGKMSWRS